MNNPSSIFLDSSAIISLCNINGTEASIGDEILDFLHQNPRASRHCVMPCLVEVYYFVKKYCKKSSTIRDNLDRLAVTLYPSEKEDVILGYYNECTYRGDYDFADFFLAYCALEIKGSLIVTRDERDFPLALSRATQFFEHVDFDIKTF